VTPGMSLEFELAADPKQPALDQARKREQDTGSGNRGPVAIQRWAQINELDAVKGPDKFLPHLLGHEAAARVIEIGPGVTHVKPGDTVVLHWRPSQGIQSRTPDYAWQGRKLNAGVGDDVQRPRGRPRRTG
jgi:NADPH:quinone reductase-like Zn-dependent oxidoreductase